ncbi:MAG: hypothetical protein FWE05_09730 [Defluviitaleaceae bacterium]|nr:hypothetical protein [Defluviitaleaceae bacterium]
MSHAYIFEGNAIAKTAAVHLAKGLNCLDTATKNPCGECLSCRTFNSGNHPDTVYVTGSKQSGIGVDDVRDQVLLPMAHKPFQYQYKIFIVDKAETLTPAAQNALLKTIEEPAPYGVFLFIATHLHHFLPTVLSRCIVKRIKEESDSMTCDPALQTLAQKISDEILGADIYKAFAMYRMFEPLDKTAVAQVLDMLYVITGQKIVNATQTGQPPNPSWFAATTAITKTKKILAQNGNAQLAIELMLNEMR